MMRRPREGSFAEVDERAASGEISDLLMKNNVLLGGSSMGKGLSHAARFFLRRMGCNSTTRTSESIPEKEQQLQNSSCVDDDVLEEDFQPIPEDPFYIVDIGIVVSQVYQWRKYFPRVEPFYAVKANPDPVIVRTLAILGCNFDCASRNEIQIVQQQSSGLCRSPEIIYANPCKGRAHVADAVRRGVRLMTFDNIQEVQKCGAVSKKIQLILRILTDDRGAQCRLSSKYGAPKLKWRLLLQAVKDNGLECVGVSFHVGSGCRDATRYLTALKDARELFDIAENEFGFNMTILDIGGGFPGETHSMWNPVEFIDEEEENPEEGRDASQNGTDDDDHFLFFTEIAEKVAPVIDELFPEDHVRVIAEPGRYLVAAAATLVASVIGARNNAVDDDFCPEPIDDRKASAYMDKMTRDDERAIVRSRGMSFGENPESKVIESIVDEMGDYSRLFAKQNLVQQEADVYNDALDLWKEDIETAADLLGPPDDEQKKRKMHTAEGVNKPLATDNENRGNALISLGAAGEAAVKGIVFQAVADSAPLHDDYTYYVNDGVYGGFNCLIFDHATVRPRQLKYVFDKQGQVMETKVDGGFLRLEDKDRQNGKTEDKTLYSSTVFGPTCDAIDVIARSVLLPRLKIGDWLYFQNMGAYTSAAASTFNGFETSEKFYTCSVQPEFFEQLIAGPR